MTSNTNNTYTTIWWQLLSSVKLHCKWICS